jgi:hypothetical protein
MIEKEREREKKTSGKCTRLDWLPGQDKARGFCGWCASQDKVPLLSDIKKTKKRRKKIFFVSLQRSSSESVKDGGVVLSYSVVNFKSLP